MGSDWTVPGQSEVLWKENLIGGIGGWEPFIPFNFSIKHRPKQSLIHVKGWERGKIVFDQQIYDRNSASFKGGRIGVLAMSQALIRYSNLSYRYLKARVIVKM